MCLISKHFPPYPLRKLVSYSSSFFYPPSFAIALILLFAIVLGAHPLWAQTTSLIIEAPKTVELKHPFVVSIITTDLPGEIQLEGKGINILGRIGMTISKSLVNGVFSERRTEQHQLIATTTGNLTIRASVGQSSKTSSIKVVQSGKNRRGSSPPSSGKGTDLATRPLTDLVRVRNRVKKTTLLVNEITELSTVIYTAVTIRNPSITKRFNESCYSLVAVDDFDRNSREVTIGGIKYYRTTIMKHLLYPVKTGNCNIDRIGFQVAVTPERGFRLQLNNEIINISTPPISLRVKDYPAKDRKGNAQPQNFNYQYGDFAVNYSLEKKRLTSNEPLPLTVSISGAGNFFTLGEPVFKNIPAGIQITKQGIIDQYQVLNNDVRGKKSFRYYLTYADYPALTSNIPLPEIEFSYFSAKDRRYVRKIEKLPNLPLSIPGPDFNGTSASPNSPNVLVDPNIAPPRWNEPILTITDLNRLVAEHPETALLHQHTTPWTTVGWYHLAGLAGAVLFALVFLFGVRLSSPPSNNSTTRENHHPFRDISRSFLATLKAILLPVASFKTSSSKPASSSTRIPAVEYQHDWERLQLALSVAKKKILVLEGIDSTAQKHSDKLIRRCSVILMKLIRSLPPSLSTLSELSQSSSHNGLRSQVIKEYWSSLALLLTLVVRSYLQIPKPIAISKVIQDHLHALKNKSDPQAAEKITWLQHAKTKLELYEELIYKDSNTDSTSPSVTTKNFKAEGKDLLSLLQGIPFS